jgi:probable phosphoglycerate mutase
MALIKNIKTTHQATKKRNNCYYLMRHGESLANQNGLIVSQAENALNDYGLTENGAAQVMKAALNTRLNRSTILVSSDFRRASETAQIMHSVIDCEHPIQHSELLRERGFGRWELSDHKNYEAVWQQDLISPDTPVNNVETVNQTLLRSLDLIDQLERQYTNKSILLVGHGDVLQILLAHQHHINPRFHRSLNSIANADIRLLAKLDLKTKIPAA